MSLVLKFRYFYGVNLCPVNPAFSKNYSLKPH
jgi:hypothetical protein